MKDFDMTIPAIFDIHEYWVLKKGQNYFKRWTPGRLCTTQNRDEAMRYPSRFTAMRSPAYMFALPPYEPEKVTVE